LRNAREHPKLEQHQRHQFRGEQFVIAKSEQSPRSYFFEAMEAEICPAEPWFEPS
jgi:hypothetical protein